MLKTIKVKKTKKLSELIEYIRKSRKKDTEFVSNYENLVNVDHIGHITTVGKFLNDTFIVEEEEEITEDTIFKTLVDVNNNNEVHIAWNDSISLYDKDQTKEIHAIVNGKLQLIWESNSYE